MRWSKRKRREQSPQSDPRREALARIEMAMRERAQAGDATFDEELNRWRMRTQAPPASSDPSADPGPSG